MCSNAVAFAVCTGSEVRLMAARAMDDWNVLDDNESVATAKARRRVFLIAAAWVPQSSHFIVPPRAIR
jgi:hypothetical protein